MLRNALAVLSALLMVATLAVLSPRTASAQAEPEYFLDPATLPFEPLDGAVNGWGEYRDAGYRYEMPADDWNGELVMWAHGFRGEGLELTVDGPPEGLRVWLIDNGYAWGASSYTKNGYNVNDGVTSTKRVAKAIRRRHLGFTREVYIVGASMGGHIAASSVERYPWFYKGAMPVCGVVGDYELFDYFLDFSLGAQQLGLGDSQFPVADNYITEQVPVIRDVMGGATPTSPIYPPVPSFPFGLSDTGEQFKSLVEIASGGERPNFDEAFVFWNAFPDFGSGPGNFLFDLGLGDGTIAGAPYQVIQNEDTVYQLDLDPAVSDAEAEFNDSIERVTTDRRSRPLTGFRNPNPITGDISVPVLTLHNLGDLFVPFHNELEYAADVAAKGQSNLLVQRAIRGVNHCDFSGQEYVEGFSDLVNWVDNGIKPDGEDFLDPAVVADPQFGCRFSRGPHVVGLDLADFSPIFDDGCEG